MAPVPGRTTRATAGYVHCGRPAMLRAIEAIETEMPVARTGEDVECVHRLRVASRRLRAALDLCAPSLHRNAARWRRPIRRMARRLRRARDLDVQVAVVERIVHRMRDPALVTGLRRLLLRLRQERKCQQTALLSALDRLEGSRALSSLRVRLLRDAPLSAPGRAERARIRRDAGNTLWTLFQTFIGYEPHIARAENAEALHRMRIAAKRLRYTLEMLSPAFGSPARRCVRRLRDVQTLLGEIHDCDVWIAWLPEFTNAERDRMAGYLGHSRGFARLAAGIEFLRCDRRRRRARLAREFVRCWRTKSFRRERKAWTGFLGRYAAAAGKVSSVRGRAS